MVIYDLIVIGAGPGGYTAALHAAAMGKRVCLFETGEIGGTCLNRGCIPTKALLHAANIYKQFQKDCVMQTAFTQSPASMLERSRQKQRRLQNGILSLLKRAKVELVASRAVIESPGLVSADGKAYHAKYILIAVGAKPAVIPIENPDCVRLLTSDDILTGEGADCQSIVIVGGGVIGCEIAELYSELDRAVTIIEADQRILPKLDRELSDGIAASFRKRGVKVFTDAKAQRIEKSENGARIFIDAKKGAETVESQEVLVAVGRSPAADNLFSCAPPEMRRGYVVTDSSHKTTVNGIYAVGDIESGSPQLAHYAEAAAKNAVNAMFGTAPCADERNIPFCVFTVPEIASVGMTSADAAALGLEVVEKKSLSLSNAKSIIETDERGFCKLIFEAGSRRLLGAHLMCPHASDMIGMLGVAISCGLTAEQLACTIFPHPTVSELIPSACKF